MARKLKDYKTIGIIGGMGPLATCDFFEKIVRMTDASCDSDHIPILIDCNPRIPDRADAILRGGEDPVPEMVKSARRLVREGASVLVMGCNTAYYFYDQVSAELPVPLINMPEETAKGALRLGYKKVGLMATDGTVWSGLYNREFEKFGIELLIPSPEGQKSVMKMVYDGIKAGNAGFDPGPFIDVANDFMKRGAEAVILGCTELPIAFNMYNIDIPYLDPAVFAAEAAITMAGGTVRPL